MLTNFIQILNDTLDRNYILWDLSVRIQAHDEHKEMLELLKAKNAKGLREALIRHIVVLKKAKLSIQDLPTRAKESEEEENA